MKTKNFSGHKNKRRVSALARLPNKDTSSNKEERKTLLERIVPQGSADAIRTKKIRPGKEKGRKGK